MVSKPQITKRLAPETTVTAGQPLTLTIDAAIPADADGLDYVWKHDGAEADPPNQTDTYEIADPNAEAHAGVYVVEVRAKKGTDRSEPESSSTVVKFAQGDGGSPVGDQGVPLVWDAKFAQTALLAAGAVLAAALIVVIILVFKKTDLARTVVLGLMILAAACTAAGIALALIDLRGRARVAEAAADPAARGLGGDFVKVLPDTLKNWGSLGLASAVLALAAVAMISATVVGWRSLPDPSPAPSSSATRTSEPSATGQSPATRGEATPPSTNPSPSGTG